MRYPLEDLIKFHHSRLSKSQKLIAMYVLKNPEKVLNYSAEQLGIKTDTSESTVMRFCTLLGFKGFIVYSFYLTIQASALFLLSKYLNFPPFDLEEMILYLGETVELFFEHDPISFIIFILAGLIIVYVTIFFMEISLAKLADGEHLKDAFDFREIKHVIETIGWNNYAIDYTKIVLALVILISINIFFTRYNGLNIIMGVITDILAFLVEYRGIGNIYREYKELTA